MEKKKKGEYGSNMVKVTLQFWTNNVPARADKKTAWESGVIYLNANKSKGIKSDMERFGNVGEITPFLKTILKRNGIKLISTNKFVEL